MCLAGSFSETLDSLSFRTRYWTSLRFNASEPVTSVAVINPINGPAFTVTNAYLRSSPELFLPELVPDQRFIVSEDVPLAFTEFHNYQKMPALDHHQWVERIELVLNDESLIRHQLRRTTGRRGQDRNSARQHLDDRVEKRG